MILVAIFIGLCNNQDIFRIIYGPDCQDTKPSGYTSLLVSPGFAVTRVESYCPSPFNSLHLLTGKEGYPHGA